MVAIKEIMSMPDGVMAPLIIVDTFLSYSWMALLVFAAAWQIPFDRWSRGNQICWTIRNPKRRRS